jgi:hypothetical protein
MLAMCLPVGSVQLVAKLSPVENVDRRVVGSGALVHVATSLLRLHVTGDVMVRNYGCNVSIGGY